VQAGDSLGFAATGGEGWDRSSNYWDSSTGRGGEWEVVTIRLQSLDNVLLVSRMLLIAPGPILGFAFAGIVQDGVNFIVPSVGARSFLELVEITQASSGGQTKPGIPRAKS
jgi:hypothetical protein